MKERKQLPTYESAAQWWQSKTSALRRVCSAAHDGPIERTSSTEYLIKLVREVQSPSQLHYAQAVVDQPAESQLGQVCRQRRAEKCERRNKKRVHGTVRLGSVLIVKITGINN